MYNPKISVIIPVFNVEKYLCHCLESVIQQTYKNLEIVLIDDGSVDHSGQVCDEYAAKDNRIVCIHQRNRGVSSARNNGIKISTGEYYHFLDSDDYIESDTYEYLLQQLNINKADAISFEYYVSYPNREQVNQQSEECYGLRDTKGAVYGHLFAGNNFLCTKLLPAYAVQGFSFREDIYRDEDTLFGLQALCRVKNTLFVSRPLLHYVQSEESACRGKFRSNQLSAVKVIPIMEELLGEKYPEWLTLWRINYIHLMIMLYVDMYFDEADYHTDMQMIYNEFLNLLKQIKIKNINTIKDKVKIVFFKLSPNIFCRVHKIIHSK